LPGCAVRLGPVADGAFNGDPILLQRAFENLLRNAAEAGATAVEITAAVDNGVHNVRIADNGAGLLPKALHNLFEPFAGSTRQGGFGLGLPIARELLRAQGGDVTLQASTPQGAVFVMRLPP
jgi:signal transduction histidine kinase